MAYKYARPLDENPFAESFLKTVLGLQMGKGFQTKVDKVVNAELLMQRTINQSTINSKSYRDVKYRSDEAREGLRERILFELITKERLDNDDKIRLGKGGALPKGGIVKSNSEATIIIGLPASGKSGIADKIADNTSSMLLDSDYAKRKIPEFRHRHGASLVHEESSAIIFGDVGLGKDSTHLYEYCVYNGHNIVIPKIGYDVESILKLCYNLKDFGYKIHLILVSLDRQKATFRALNRFIETNRYVPLSLIFDGYSNDPILTYYRLKENDIIYSYGKISTDVNKGENPLIIEASEGSPVLDFMTEEEA